jgi:purine nucleosidase
MTAASKKQRASKPTSSVKVASQRKAPAVPATAAAARSGYKKTNAKAAASATRKQPAALRSIIIDSDAGSDDAVAIVLAFRHARVHAMLSVHGNVDQAQATDNLQLMTQLFHVPAQHGPAPLLYAGAVHPLLGRHRPLQWPGHGTNGLGDAVFSEREAPVALRPRVETGADSHAAAALVRMLRDAPGQHDVIALGPLTNVALALKLEPRAVHWARSWWVMGGAHHGRGNSSPLAEFNFFQDPEAAAIVLQAFDDSTVDGRRPQPLNIVSWESCEDSSFQWTDFDRLAGVNVPTASRSFAADFLRRASAAYEKCSRGDAATSETTHWAPCDAYAMAALLSEPASEAAASGATNACVAESRMLHAAVETGGTLARGALAIDWYAIAFLSASFSISGRLVYSRRTFFLGCCCLYRVSLDRYSFTEMDKQTGIGPNIRLVTKVNRGPMMALLEAAYA